MRDNAFVDEKRLKELGAYGLVKLGKDGVQVIFGGKAQNIRDEIEEVLATGAVGPKASKTPEDEDTPETGDAADPGRRVRRSHDDGLGAGDRHRRPVVRGARPRVLRRGAR